MKRILILIGSLFAFLLLPLVPAKAVELSVSTPETIVIDLTEIPDDLVIPSAEDALSTGRVNPNGTRMTYLAEVSAEVHITPEGVATTHAEAHSYDERLTNLLVVAELQQLRNGQWTTIRTYRYFTGDSYVILDETCNVERGYYYRVRNTTTAYAGNDSETRVATTPEWNFYVPGT